MTTSTHTSAREYHRMGLPITLCPPGSKRPFPKGWQAKRWTIREINREFRTRGNLNVGAVLGARAKFFDIETDSRDGDAALIELFDGEPAVTPTFKSNRGSHRLFAYDPALEVIGKATIHVGPLEIRLGTGGKAAQSLLPPSVTDGCSREWKVPLDECPPAPLPESVLRRLLTDFSRVPGLTQRHRVHSNTSGTVLLCKPSLTVADAIRRTLPSEVGHRRNQIFTFVRCLKSIPEFASADLSALLPIVQQWHQAALPVIGTKDFETTFADFADGWISAKYAIGEGPLQEVYMTAITKPLPPCADRFKCDSLRRMVLLCRELQHHSGDKPFYLACRSAGDVLGVTHVVAHKWLRLLVHEGILELVTPGTRHRAAEYRYVAD
jgi:hypothetical protein